MKRSLSDCQKIALSRGGFCLSSEYINNHTKYLWKCQEGHEWYAKFLKIQQGQWCARCSGVARHDVFWLQEIASLRGGFCLSDSYTNNKFKYQWECSLGHTWEAVASDIQQGQWCPLCRKSAHKDLTWLRGLALKHQGISCASVFEGTGCLSLWICNRGHQFKMRANNVQQGQWCPHCAGLAPKNLEWLQKLASDKDGLCLSSIYINSHTKYPWKCQKGHEWEATSGDIQQGHWCPKCAHQQSKAEFEIYNYVLDMFPDALSRQRGLLQSKKLELDIYIPSLKKAIEFDGYYWHKSDWAIKHGQPECDARKNKECLDAGIQLLRVDELDFSRNPKSERDRILIFLLY